MPKPVSQLKAVFFDLDDTIYDHRHSCMCGLSKLREIYPPLQDYEVGHLEADYLLRLNILHELLLQGLITQEESRYKRIGGTLNQHGVHLEGQELEQACRIYEAGYKESRRPVPGMMELIIDLRTKGIPSSIITNGFNNIQEDKLQATGLDKIIDFMITSETAGTAKPDPDIFQMAMDRYHITPEQTLMVGDNWNIDILGGVNAGIPTVWINRRGYACPDPSQAYEIKTAEELRALLQPFLN